MKIRTKVVVLLSAVFFALALVEWGVGRALLLPRFEAIELDNAHTAMKRIDFGVHQTLNELQVNATDWGNWTDTYVFMVDHNARFQQGNLSESAMKQLRLTTQAFISLQGNVVMSRAIYQPASKILLQEPFVHGSLPRTSLA
jgi:sensor domain CHASE-containing protein